DIDTSDFQGRLSKGGLTLEPKQHFESEAQVCPLADKFIQGWEVAAGLQYGRPDFRFRFEGSHIEEREPAPGTRSLHLSEHGHMTETLHIKRIYNTYPVPPEEFQVTPEVEVLWDRYCRFVEGREPLLAMAYFCLSFIERGNRTQAAQHYSIQSDVLKKLGELTSTRGDKATARKLSSTTEPLSSSEATWIESAIKEIIKHLATLRPGQILKMTDLPLWT
ncbi:MAG: hypothetical protein ACREOB_04845, partial [Thermodesulfobacteriota bacterium]